MEIGQSSSPVEGADLTMPPDVKGLEVYELNLEKYKVHSLSDRPLTNFYSDRRDTVQKKTFTKWVNKHLKKADGAVQVENLFNDLQDGELLILLLEVLTGELLVKLVNIRAEDIVDGNTKLTLGLIWTIILHFQLLLMDSSASNRWRHTTYYDKVEVFEYYYRECICRASLQNVAHGIAFGCLSTTGSTVSLLSYFLSAYGNVVDSSSVSVSRRSGCGDGDDDSSHSPTILSAADERQFCQPQYYGSCCVLIQCHWFSLYAALLGASLFLLFLAVSSKSMYKILKSYHKKAERKHEVTCDAPPTAYRQSEVSGNGTVIPVAHSWKPMAGGGYSESSSYETHAHYERKIQRVKKTRGDRDRSSHRRSGDKRLVKVSEPWSPERYGGVLSAKEGLLQWAQQVTQGYPGVNLVNFTTSWSDGLALCAIMHHYRPSMINWRDVRRRMSARERLETAFRLAENEFGVTKLLDPEDVDVELPDEKSVMTYVSSLYDALESADAEQQYDHEFNQYCSQAHTLYTWIKRQIENYTHQSSFLTSADAKKDLAELERFRAEDLPSKSRDKHNLSNLYSRLEELFDDTEFMGRAAPPFSEISELWDQLMNAINIRERSLHGDQSGAGSPAFLQNLEHQIGVMNERLDLILRRIEDANERSGSLSQAELQALLNGIVTDLNDLEAPIEDLFAQTENLLSSGYPNAHKLRMQAFGLHQRRIAYLQRCNAHLLLEPDVRGEYISRLEQDRYAQTKEDLFSVVKQCIEWVERRLVELSEMKFKESLPFLEELLENHKIDHREIIDFHYQVDQCIARQVEIAIPDTEDYCNHLITLEKEYFQLRELSTGRMLDLDSLIAFVRAAQLELVWISEREEIEISRNWADIDQLDLPMLQNYYKQLMHEIELREAPFNMVHDQGAALVNQRHPAVDVIDMYLTTMQSQWDWLLGLTQCLDAHLHDALSLREFLDEAGACERWIELQLQTLEAESSKGTLKVDDGDRLLEQLDEMREYMDKYFYVLASLAERSRTISPLWQRAEPILMQIPVTALCNYVKKDAVIRKGDQCTLLDNSESLTSWSVRTEDGMVCDTPSVIFRIPPPDERIVAYYQRLQSMFERLRRNWHELYQSARYAMMTRAMREICGWDLKEFLGLDPETRDNIIRALNDDVNRFLDELDKNDPMAVQLRDELNATNEHFYKLLQQAMREPDADAGEGFDRKATQLIQDLEEAWRLLNQRVNNAIPKTIDKLELLIDEHKANAGINKIMTSALLLQTFEDDLQARDSEVSMVQELFRQLNNPSPLQRSLLDQVLNRWEDLWDMSKMYAERLKAVEVVLGSIAEATEIVLAHERTLGSCDTMPAVLDKLRSLHAELLEIQLVLQQQQPIFQDLASNVVKMRQYVARTRPNMADHFDVDRAEEVVQRLTVRWENICTQVIERLKFTELAIPILLVYRGAYEDEMAWLDRVEATINSLRSAESLEPDEHQEQLDLLMAEYANLNERTVAVEKVNREGGRFIREAKLYDLRTGQYRTFLTDPQLSFGPLSAVSGVQQVSKELDELNRRFSQLASVILERRNVIQVLMQNYRRKKEYRKHNASEIVLHRFHPSKAGVAVDEAYRFELCRKCENCHCLQEEDRRHRAMEEAARRAEDEARRRAENEAERLRRLKEEEERRRKAAEDEANRLRKLREEEEARRLAEEARRKAEAEAKRLAEEALQRAEDEARRRAAEEARRKADEEAARLRAEEEDRRRAAEEARRRREEDEARRRAQEEADRLRLLREREQALKRAEEEAHRRAEEEARRRAEEEARRKLEAKRAEEEARKLAEEGARRKAEEDARRRAEEEARRRAEDEARKRAEEEARRRAEDEARRRADEEARRRADEETRRRAGEEARRRADDEARRRAEEEARRRAEEEARRRADEEARRRADEEARRRADEEARRRADEEARRRAEEEARRRAEEEARRRAEEEARRQQKLPTLDIKTGRQYGEAMEWGEAGELEEAGDLAGVVKFSEHEEDMVMYAEETEIRTKFFELEAVKHLQTGEILTFVEAARQGVLDLKSGEFFDVVSGSRMSLEQAVQHGFVSQSLTDCLNSRYGIHCPETRESLTLLEAIQRGIYDPECRQLKNPKTGEILTLFDASRLGVITMDNVHRLIKMGVLKLPPLHLQQAIEQAVIDLQTGTFIGRFSRETLPLTEALRNGYVTLSAPSLPMIGVTLTECIEQRFIEPNTGEFLDRFSGEKISLREALSKKDPLINLETREIVHTQERRRISVGDAVLRNVINTRLNNFTDTLHRQTITLLEAYEKELIQQPMTLFDICAKGLTDSSGRFVDGGTKRRMVLLEAIADGLIDPDVPHIVDSEENEVVSLAMALERGIVSPTGEYITQDQQRTISIQEAIGAELVVCPVRYSVFDIKAVRDTKKKVILSFTEAIDEGVVMLDSKRFMDTLTNECYVFDDLKGTNLVDPLVLNALSQQSGLKEIVGNRQLIIFEAIAEGYLDPKKRVLLNRHKQHFSPRDAYEAGLISLRGAMLMSALFNVHPSLVSLGKASKPQRKRVGRPKAPPSGIKMTLGEALYQGLVDPKTRVVEGDRDMSLQEAVDVGFLDSGIEWIVPDKGTAFGPTIQESQSETVTETSQVLKPRVEPDKQVDETLTTVKRQRITETTAVGGPGGVSAYRAISSKSGHIEVPVDGLHLYAAQRQGLFDLNTGVMTVPDVQREFTFEEALELGVINGNSIKARDRRTSSFISAADAISAGILDSNGFYVDSLTGQRFSLQAAIDADLVTVEPETVASPSAKVIQFRFGPLLGSVVSFKPTGTSVHEVTEARLSFNALTGEVVDVQTNERFSLDEALRLGKVTEGDIVVTDALTERQFSFTEAEKWLVIDPSSKMYMNKRHNRICSLQEAAKQGLVSLNFGIADASSDVKETYLHRQSRKVVSTKEPVLAGPAAFVDYSLQQVIELGWYDRNTGSFTHPDTKKQMTLKQAIIKGLFNPYESTVIDPSSKEEMSLLDAIQSGLLDADAGRVRDAQSGSSYDLEEACRSGIISSGIVAQSLDALISSGRLDLSHGEVSFLDGRAPLLLHEAIANGLVNTSTIRVVDPSSNEELSFEEAVKKKVVNPSRGLVINKRTGDAVSFVQAIRSGQMKPVACADAIRYQQQLVGPPPTSIPGSVSTLTPFVPARVTKAVGKGREEVIDIGGKQVMVKVIRDEQGVEKGEYVDPETKMKFTVQLHGDPYTTRTQTSVKSTAQVQSVELSPFAELVGIDKVKDKRSGRTMTLIEAQRAGIASVDRKGKQLTKTYSVFRSDIAHALNYGIIDPTTNEKLSLEDAIKSRIVDIEALVMWHPETGERVDFAQAANVGLMDVTLAEVLPKGVCNPVNGERISIQRAIELKIINPRTGSVVNPFSNEKLSWVSILKPVYASMVMEGVYDPRKGYAVPVTRALNEGLIDVQQECYCNPITGEVLPLKEASSLGLIDESTYEAVANRSSIYDHQTGEMISLLQAVKRGLVNPHDRTVVLDKGVTVSVAKAVEDGKFPKELGRLLRRVDKWTFAEALGQGLIDVTTNQFTDPDSGRKMTISAALEQGYIDTGSVEALDGMDERNLSNVIDSDEFDENSGRIRDRKSGLYLTFRQAIERGIIDPDSLIYDVSSGRTVTLSEALYRGRIDSNGKFVDSKTGAKVNLRDAVRVGLIAVIASPMLASQAVTEAIKRRETEGFRFAIDRSLDPHVQEGSSRPSAVFEESISVKGSQPQHVFRLRRSGDPSTTAADAQADFLAYLLKESLDLNDPILKNPVTSQLTSIRDAVDNGLLDVTSGEMVNPKTGEHFSITRAVQLHLIPAKVASSIMTALNKSMEERDVVGRHSGVQQPRTTVYTREIVWEGQPSELRASDGDMSKYTTVTGVTIRDVLSTCRNEIETLSGQLKQWRNEVAELAPEELTSRENVLVAAERITVIKGFVEGVLPTIRAVENRISDHTSVSVEFLTPAEFQSLLQIRDDLLEMYDSFQQCILIIIDRLRTVTELSSATVNSIIEFRHWLDKVEKNAASAIGKFGEPSTLEMSRISAEALETEIGSQKSLLATIKGLEDQLNANINDCLIEFNILRRSAEPPLPSVEYRHSSDSQSSKLADAYMAVLQRVLDFKWKVSHAICINDNFVEVRNRVERSLSLAECSTRMPLGLETTGTDVQSLRDSMLELQNTSDELVPQKFLLTELRRNAKEYDLLVLHTGASASELTESIDSLEHRLKNVEEELTEKRSVLQSKLCTSESLQKKKNDFDDWLYEVESKGNLRPLLPLQRKQLREFVEDQRLVLADIARHQQILSSLTLETPDVDKGTFAELCLLQQRLRDVQEDAVLYCDHLQEAFDTVDNFEKLSDLINDHLNSMLEELSSIEFCDQEMDPYSVRLQLIREAHGELRDDVALMKTAWTEIQAIPNKSDADFQACQAKMHDAQELWKKADRRLTEQEESLARRKAKMKEYEQVTVNFSQGLTEAEHRFASIGQVAMLENALDRQLEEVRLMLTAHSQLRSDLNAVEAVSMSDNDVGYTDSTEPTFMAKKTKEFSDRYESLGKSLREREAGILALRGSLSSNKLLYDDLISRLRRLLEQAQQFELPSSQSELERCHNDVKELKEKVAELSTRLDEYETSCGQLIDDAKDSYDCQNLRNKAQDLGTLRRNTVEKVEQLEAVVKELNDFFSCCTTFECWLNTKEKCVELMAPVPTDAKEIESQLMFMDALREEFNTQASILCNLRAMGQKISLRSEAMLNKKSIAVEEKTASCTSRWEHLLALINDRSKHLVDSKKISSRLFSSLGSMQTSLNCIMLAVTSYTSCPTGTDLESLASLKSKLEEHSRELPELEGQAQQFCSLCDNPVVLVDVQSKLAALRQLNEEIDRKINGLQVAAENKIAERSELEKKTLDLLNWARSVRQSLDGFQEISADPQCLLPMCNQLDALYENVLAREGEISWLLSEAKAGGCLSDGQLGENCKSLEIIWQELLSNMKRKKAQLSAVMELEKQLTMTWDNFKRKQESIERQLAKCESDVSTADLERAETLKLELNEISANLASTLSDRDAGTVLVEKLREQTNCGLEALSKSVEQDGNRLENLHDTCRNLHAMVDHRQKLLQERAASVTDSQNCLRRLTDSLSHCCASSDTRELARLEQLKDEMQQAIEQNLIKMQNLSANGAEPEEISELQTIQAELVKLQDHLGERMSELGHVVKQCDETRYTVDSLLADIQKADAALNNIDPRLRTSSGVDAALETVNSLQQILQAKKSELATCEEQASALEAAGYTVDAAQCKQRVSQCRASLESVMLLAEDKGFKLESIKTDLDQLLKEIEQLYSGISELLSSDVLQIPLIIDLADTTNKIEELDAFRQTADTMAEAVRKTLLRGNYMLKSAAPGADCAELETKLTSLQNITRELLSKISEQVEKAEGGLRTADAYRMLVGELNTWLTDTEELVSNQRPPSSHYKVAKAQLREQMLLRKFLKDKQIQLDRLGVIFEELYPFCNEDSFSEVTRQLQDLSARFERLREGEVSRTELLEDVAEQSQLWHERGTPLITWIEDTQKRLQELDYIAINEEKLTNQRSLVKEVLDDVESHCNEIDKAVVAGQCLKAMLCDTEAAEVDKQLCLLINGYHQISESAALLDKMMDKMSNCVVNFVEESGEISERLHEMEERLRSARPVSVYVDVLDQQTTVVMELGEEISKYEARMSDIMEKGRVLCESTSGDEALMMQSELEALRMRYSALNKETDQFLGILEEALPLADTFHKAHASLSEWLLAIESDFLHMTELSVAQQVGLLKNIQDDIDSLRHLFEEMNSAATKLSQLTGEDGASTVESMASRLNRRFDSVCDQMQRKSERLSIAQVESAEIASVLDDLIDWFQKMEATLDNVVALSIDPVVAREQLRNQELAHADVMSQRSKAREANIGAKRVIKLLSGDDRQAILDRVEALQELVDNVSEVSCSVSLRLGEAVPFTVDFEESCSTLEEWLTTVESELENLPILFSGVQADQLKRQLDYTTNLQKDIMDQRLVVEKLNRSGTFIRSLLCAEDDMRVADIMEQMNLRFDRVKENVHLRLQTLDEALAESSQFTDKLDGMLDSLSLYADTMQALEPISSYPDRIRHQISDNLSFVRELERKNAAYEALLAAASDIISKASPEDAAGVEDIRQKIALLQKLWSDVLQSAEMRGQNLQETLAIAETFWIEYQNCLEALKELQRRVQGYDKPACEIEVIKVQQLELQEAEDEFRKQEPRVTQCREIGQQLLDLVSNAEKPEIRQKIDELDVVYETVTEAFARRGHDLIDAMERTMSFYEKLQKVTDFMAEAEEYVKGFHTISTEPVTLHEQLVEVGKFKEKLDENAVDLEQLNQLAVILAEGTSPGQSSGVQATVDAVSKRWEVLSTSVIERQHKLEKALLQMGHFHQAISQLIDWIERTEETIGDVGSFPGDQNRNEIESAKLKVIQNDILAHQISVDTLNSTIRKTDDSSKELHDKLDDLNFKWSALHRLFHEKAQQLEKCKQESETITDQINEYLSWITDVDNSIFGNRSFGGLPETAHYQLERFMNTYEEVINAKPKVADLLANGDHFLESSGNEAPFADLLKTFKQRWEGLLQKVSDRKIKLELALQEAIEFDKLMNHFIDWLAQAEGHLNSLEPVSRLKERLVSQMQQHQTFQEEVDAFREKAHELDKRGTKIKYTCQKQDATTIKNLLATTMSRWNKVLNRTADRSKLLDNALCETQSFMDQWTDLSNWCSQSMALIQEESSSVPSNVDKIKEALAGNAEFRQLLMARQADFEAVNRLGKRLKNHGIRDEEKALDDMLVSLRDQWNKLFSLANERQQKLEEALLFSGQFKEAVSTLMDYLVGAEERLSSNVGVYGDLDSVITWEEEHKAFMNHLNSRQSNVETIRQAAKELIGADPETNTEIEQQVQQLEQKWARVNELSREREASLVDSRKMAEKFHHDAHALLELLAGIESKAKDLGGVSDQEHELAARVDSFDQLSAELGLHEPDLSNTLAMGADIVNRCHPNGVQPMQRWLSLLGSRWDETNLLLSQRTQRLKSQLLAIQEQDILLDDLIEWMLLKEEKLNEDRRTEIPTSVEQIEQLIREHELFENELRQRQPDVDEVTKGHRRAEAEEVKEVAKGSRRPVRSSAAPPVRAKIHHRKRNTKVQLVADKWRELWLQSMERNKKLADALEIAKEVRRLENFSFDDWRTRYLTWINHKKSRVMDFFRRQDKDCDGRVTRDEFIDGILACKFPTSRVEMNYVADIFDRNNEGYIDYMEFIDALRPVREPVTEAEKIKDEVQRQTELCTCVQKYRIKEVGDGKYKFGEQIRLVRILRSTVMVRVGGGWVSLNEYLVKYDPCRTRGRTNIELREKFILPEGASQSMCYFKSKGNRGHLQTGSRSSSTSGFSALHSLEHEAVLGPIVKIREKTERSMPMRSLPRSCENSPGLSVCQLPHSSSFGSFKLSGANGKPISPGHGESLNGYQTLHASSMAKTVCSESRLESDQSMSASRPSSRASSDVSELSYHSHDSSPFQSRIPSIRKKRSDRRK
ncbi:VAB 10A protein [Trichuris trichiura]|uniref:VAB 10A protein n=1 Tax=Trichuris trichiura TaxID=36087 RepID=A0A077ZB12_TRITR|nr:VAB 10A protein [Trichuris trichiura]